VFISILSDLDLRGKLRLV